MDDKKKTQHYTPGPWSAFVAFVFDDEQTSIIPPAAEKERHALIAVVSTGHLRPDGEANVRLIAAAPDLLAACEEWIEADGPSVSLDEQRRRWGGIMERMAAAVAKARGES